MYRTLIVVLYGSGLHIGEALGLTLGDVDVLERVISVSKTKFFKTRLAPIGPKLAQELRAQMEPAPAAADAGGRALGPVHNAHGEGVALPTCRHVVSARPPRRLLRLPCLRARPPQPARSAAHRSSSLRCSVVPHRQGCSARVATARDLSGDVNIKSTQSYLRMTPSCSRRPASASRATQSQKMAMPVGSLLGNWGRRYLLEHLVAEDNLSPNTQASDRDT